jgi:hypothetical protein
MSRSEREAFLAGLHVGVLSIERAGKAPLAVSIWYDFEPTIGVWLITGRESEKGRALVAAGRFSLCARDGRAVRTRELRPRSSCAWQGGTPRSAPPPTLTRLGVRPGDRRSTHGQRATHAL